jgi:hypothetical protein
MLLCSIEKQKARETVEKTTEFRFSVKSKSIDCLVSHKTSSQREWSDKNIGCLAID